MPPDQEKPSSRKMTSPAWKPKSIEVAVLATAISICRNMEKPSRLEGKAQWYEPKDCIQGAYELLSASEIFLEREFSMNAQDYAEAERKKLKGLYNPAKEYAWKDVIKRQQGGAQDKDSMDKFSPRKLWPRLKSKFESGAFHFTDKDLVNRPLGLSMVGSITTEKGLRKAIKRLFADEASHIIKSQVLSLWQINIILTDQLGRNHGNIPKPRAKSTAG